MGICYLVLILSRGNASLESGFSVNSSIFVENMHENSIVAQRTVYDAIQAADGVLKVDINKTVQQFVRTSRSRYQDALQRQREQLSYEDKRRQEKKRAADQIKLLKSKIAQLVSEATAEAIAIEGQIAELTKLSSYVC